ncbi:MAG: glycoside hydrolase family 2 TIM barrel-domain containing protein [Crocinitomicaceae bacterium]|nr:glycoside hydrolase family 2 TIM barrel-domain containing protein [Crocinitomicaceae bacterium]
MKTPKLHHTLSERNNALLKRALFSMIVFFSFTSFSQVEPVTVSKEDGKWTLLVKGEPFYIKGAGGEKHLDVLLECGGNTIRTWGVENAQEVLDLAQKKGLKVMMGLWVQHERHGFDYNDEDKIRKQLESFRLAVRRYKDHPALLLWGIGNEYELQYNNTKVWKAVNDIAEMVQEEDPNHPTSTVTAGTNDVKVAFVKNELTAIDIYGINTYGDIGNVHKVLEKANFERPYMITEWGPNGHWESPKTRWGASIEQTSSEKAAVYKDRYEKYIWDKREQCLGSFAFLWGQKQEYTSTWYGVFTEDGEPTEAIDVLEYNWKGEFPENRAPKIEDLKINGNQLEKNTILGGNEKVSIEVLATDMNSDKLKYSWELYPESTDLKSGGDAENKPVSILGRLSKKSSPKVEMKAPIREGKYRLFVTVTDGVRVSYANIPFYVDPKNMEEDTRVRFIQQDIKSFEDQ